MNAVRSEFAKLATREPIPLARGALLIAKEDPTSTSIIISTG